ncbi:hypothetical protein [Thalassobacillus sp. CUG 92003]|uniref:hypothetical protein n=1 Tax=Thalassobacillus sp. CUG 92003 TaxID=2736641 RepID=UPI0015E6D82D|nr:hypothetical protein [Thalassobacillus sp. CUG 92003]
MVNLIKADLKKIVFLASYRNYLITTFILSVVLGLTFVFTIGVTQGKELTELRELEVLDISLLGMDVAAIMLIVFSARFISADFSQGSIHTALAIMPLRQKFYLAKVLFITAVSIILCITLTLSIVVMDQLILLGNDMHALSLGGQAVLLKLFGTAVMPLFYSLLSIAGTFYLRSMAGGVTFAIGIMFLPAFVDLFPTQVTGNVLMALPERSLHTIADMSVGQFNGQMVSAGSILLAWLIVTNAGGMMKLNKTDF